MKKKIISALLAVSAVLTTTALASEVQFESKGETRAVLTCFDQNGRLVYSNLYKSEDGKFTADVPSEYDGLIKKVYYLNSKNLVTLPAAEPSPSVTPAPEATAKPEATVKPSPTAKPQKDYPSIYEKEVDMIQAMALVKDVEIRTNNNDEEIFGVTVLYQGKEMTVGIEDDITISSAPDAYKDLIGKTVESLERGDVICMTANIAGDTIRTIDLLFRPTKEDIVTGDTDYGTNFEKLYTQNGKAAGKWDIIPFDGKPSSERYQYVFGVVAFKDTGSLTLLNKNGVEDEEAELDIRKDTLVYTCDVDGREYTVELGDVSDIKTTLSQNIFDREDPFVYSTRYRYNYALARVVDGITTELILFNNYNE